MTTATGAPRMWFAVFMIVACFGLLVVIGIAYTNHVQREAAAERARLERYQCDWYGEVAAPAAELPAEPRARARAQRFQRLAAGIRREMGCPPLRP